MIIRVYGCPIAQPRHQTGKHGSYIKPLKDGSPHPIKGFKEHIYWACFNAVRDLDNYPLKGGVCVDIDFVFKRHKGLLKSQKYKITKPDRDNLEKAVYDAMNKIIYRDDGQICDGRTRKLWGNESLVIITISEV